MKWSIVQHTLTMSARKQVTLIFIISFLALLAGSLWVSYYRYSQEQKQIDQANEMTRQQWLGQGNKNPHAAAHFGNIVTRPQSVLSFFDAGTNSFAGTVTYLEPHKQNGLQFVQASDEQVSFRMGMTSPAQLFQLFYPLLIVFFCYATISSERENSILKLILSQGISPRNYVLQKIGGNFLITGSIAALGLLFIPVVTAFSDAHEQLPQALARGGCLILLYLVYVWLVTALATLFSYSSTTTRASLVGSLVFWMGACILIPKIAAGLSAHMYSAPSKLEFDARVAQQVKKGVDGHNSEDKRLDSLKNYYLAKYKVDDLAKLPVNFTGILLQYGEDYTAKVYEENYRSLHHIFSRQNKAAEWFGFINPLLAVQHLSLALAGTDYYNFHDFQQATEKYRYYFVQELNKDQEMHAGLADWEYKTSAQLYKRIRPFIYKPLSLSQSLGNHIISLLALLWWVLFIALILLKIKTIKL